LRRYLVAEERAKISDEENPWQACPCFRDLPIDARRGPYPVVVFVHGTAAFRHQSAQTTAHWASHGFVVVAMDHPGIYLADMLQLNISPQQDQDARELLADLRAFRGELAWLSGHVDLQHIALAGHSAGGYALESLGDEAGVKMLLPMAAAGTLGPSPKVYSLVMGALDDQVVPWARAQTGYDETPGAKMLVGLKNAGHLAYSDICAIGRDRGGLIQLLQDTEINLPEAAGDTLERLGTDGCALDQMTPRRGWTLINHITTTQLKATLQCRGTALDAQSLRAAYDSELLVSVP
jgi:predicted dienelactone hydrolase